MGLSMACETAQLFQIEYAYQMPPMLKLKVTMSLVEFVTLLELGM